MASKEGDGTVREPLNREGNTEKLISNFTTETEDLQYDRNHGPISHLSADGHTIKIDGLSIKPITLSMRQLQEMKQHSVTAALQCAGNRRHEMRTRIREVQGIDWFDAAIMNAKWQGPLLADVLQGAGIDSSAKDKSLNVQFACYQTPTQEDSWYGSSVSLKRALDSEMEIVLALKMNDEVLNDKRGFPVRVRVIVPGILGARSVMWLDRITVSEDESPNYYMQHDYKVLPPEAKDKESAEKFWGKVDPMIDNVINCVVGMPVNDETLERTSDGKFKIKGYAVPQGASGPVIKVEVSTDEGRNWHEASIGAGGQDRNKWAWVLWEIEMPMEKGEGRRIFCRATDKGGNTQTEKRSEWNLRGVGCNGYESMTGLNIV